MTARKSVRLQQQDQAPVKTKQTATAQAESSKKRKAPASKNANEDGTREKKPKNNGRDKVPLMISSNAVSDKLSSLPAEILDQILDNIQDPSTIGKLGRTSKRYYSLMTPLLHKRVAVAAMFHAHISKVIRSLEPHLSIKQKRLLKKEGQYKGQQEKYPSSLDVDATPTCASYVRELILGVSDPGKKHQYIVLRYYEEVLKNLSNLEVIDSWTLTGSLAESIASLEHLRALRLTFITPSEADEVKPLARIKNLAHLSVEMSSNEKEFVPAIIANSASTLQSLAVKSNEFGSSFGFWKDWNQIISKNVTLRGQKHSLSSLKAFTLVGYAFNVASLKSLDLAIDLMSLCELVIGRLSEGQNLFFQHLTSLANRSTVVDMRRLAIDMSDNYQETPENSRTNLEAKCQFLSSFQSLTSLDLQDYNQYPSTVLVNPGIPSIMVQAIVKHSNLRKLKISYNGIHSKIPYLSAVTVAAIVEGLPLLQEFTFAPEETEINDIAKALAQGKNLKEITCFPFDSWSAYPRPDEPGLDILIAIIKALLDRSDLETNRKLTWEDNISLRRVTCAHVIWDIASVFGKSLKGMKKPVKVISETHKDREVLYRDITGTRPIHIHVGYDPEFEWVQKVSR